LALEALAAPRFLLVGVKGRRFCIARTQARVEEIARGGAPLVRMRSEGQIRWMRPEARLGLAGAFA